MYKANLELEQDEVAYILDKGYLYIQSCDTGYDYTVYGLDFNEIDGGQLDNPKFSIDQAAQDLIEDYFPHSKYTLMSIETLQEFVKSERF